MDLVVVLLILAMLPIVMVRPYVGAILYTVIAYLKPQNIVEGLAMQMRPGLVVLTAMTVGFAIGLARGRERPVLKLPFFGLLALLCLSMFVSTQTAIFPEIAMSSFMSFLQLLAGVVFTVMLCNTPERLRGVLVTVALALGTMAIISLVDPFYMEGRLTGAGGMFRDSNDFALALVMVLPLLVYMRRNEPRPWLKALLTIPIPFVLTAIVLTQSRGGFLALAVVGVAWVFSSRGRVVRMALAPIGALLFFGLAPPSYVERITTIRSYEYDSSARDRLSSWNVAKRIARERPLTGVGPGNFIPVYRRYANDTRSPHVAHNAVLQFLADSGAVSALLYVTLVLGGLVSAQRIATRVRAFRSRTLREPEMNGAHRARARRLTWIDDYAQGIVLSLLGFTVGAQFLSSDRLDLLYLIAGLAGVLVLIARRELKAEGYAPSAARRKPIPAYHPRPDRVPGIESLEST